MSPRENSGMQANPAPRPALGDAQMQSEWRRHAVYLGADAAGGLVFGPPQVQALVLGPPRSGKTSCIVVPNVLAANGPVVVASTKRDILDATWQSRQRVGRVHVFDPGGEVEPPPGVARIGWDPLRASGTWDGAILVVEAMTGAARPGATGGLHADPHWTERANALLAPMFHAAAVEGLTMRDLVSWVDRRTTGDALSILAKADAERACGTLTGVARTEERELSGIWSTASGILAAYRSEAALRASEGDVVDPGRFLDPANGASTLYICASGQHQRHAAPLVAGVVDELRRAAYARPAGSVPVLAVLDELANIAPIRDLPRIASEGGSQGMMLLACLQDLSQARARWGPEADGFMTLFGSKILMPGIGDMRTLEAASALAGDGDVPTRSTTRSSLLSRVLGHGRDDSVSTASRRQRRLPVDEIAQGRSGQALVIGNGQPPAFVRLTPYYGHPLWRGAAGLPPPEREIPFERRPPARSRGGLTR
jgi:type IV secretion system protein VirD4